MMTTRLQTAAVILAAGAGLFLSSAHGQLNERNPFAGFETYLLANGLKLWFKPMPGEPNVSINVLVAVGSEDDPPGKEQLAHFLEHMLFSDHRGRTTEEIWHEISDKGGQSNGMTTTNRTIYFVNVDKEDGLFALDWLYRVISPHDMDAAVVDRERQPVALEIGARPRSVSDWLEVLYVDPPWLKFGGTWERHFGFETNFRRDIYSYRSLNSITPEDLRAHYEKYYVPGRMTLTVVGDLDRDDVIAAVEGSFGSLVGEDFAPEPVSYQMRETEIKEYFYNYRPNVRMRRGWRIDEVTADDSMMLDFIARISRIRLNDALRFGDFKASYGVSTGFARRGPAAYFSVQGNIGADDIDAALAVVDAELAMLREGTLPADEFETARTAVTEQLRIGVETPLQLSNFTYSVPWDRAQFEDVPDLFTRFQSIELADVAAFLSERLVENRESTLIVRPMPIPEWLAAVIVITTFLATVRIMRRQLVRPIDMTRIRYIARIRISWLYAPVAGAIGLMLLAVLLRALYYVYEWIGMVAIIRIDSFWVQYFVYALMGVSLLIIVILAMGRIPAKILVFDDKLLIKYLTFRSVEIPFNEMEQLSILRFGQVWLSNRIRKCFPFKLGLLAPGIYLQRRNGRGYYFDVRNREELNELLATLTVRVRNPNPRESTPGPEQAPAPA
jgi:predicted Zn-dependent peptidase